jgi:hypothetical protein
VKETVLLFLLSLPIIGLGDWTPPKSFCTSSPFYWAGSPSQTIYLSFSTQKVLCHCLWFPWNIGLFALAFVLWVDYIVSYDDGSGKLSLFSVNLNCISIVVFELHVSFLPIARSVVYIGPGDLPAWGLSNFRSVLYPFGKLNYGDFSLVPLKSGFYMTPGLSSPNLSEQWSLLTYLFLAFSFIPKV